jgi:hypothetical protein
MMLRAEFPVHRNRTLNSRFAIILSSYALVFAQHAVAGVTVFASVTGRRSSP